MVEQLAEQRLTTLSQVVEASSLVVVYFKQLDLIFDGVQQTVYGDQTLKKEHIGHA